MTTSFIIPCFNEQERLKKNFPLISQFIKKRQKDEFIFVDDGSGDKTATQLNKFQTDNLNVKILRNNRNLGKGAAVKKGVLTASKESVLFLDADLSTPFYEVASALELLKTNDIVIGVRKHKLAKIIKHQPIHREIMGKAFTWFANKLILHEINDATCGFKAFSLESAVNIFTKTKINRWVFDVEILFIAQKYKYKIKQMPVNWENDENTRVSIVRDTVTSIRDLLRIKLYDTMKMY